MMTQEKKRRRRKIAVVSLLLIAALSLAAPFSGLLLTAGSGVAVAQEGAEANPRSGYWREVRGANSGISTVDGQEAGVLINDNGQDWRRLRNGVVATYMPYALLAVLALLVLYHLLHGRTKVSESLSGRKVLRWQVYERVLHFSVAGSFILLAITGLSLLFGRALLIPVMGKDAFAAYAGVAKDVHNYLGPLFAGLLAVMILLWMRHNFFKPEDWDWLKKGGGMFGGAHPHAGRMNGGEKVWFWIIATVGVAVCVSGLVLDFPNYQQGREAMQVANIIHAVLSILWIAVALGHIYLGTLGTEGALEGMTTGYVSEEWARQHHDLWLEEVQQQREGGDAPAAASAPAPASAEPAQQQG